MNGLEFGFQHYKYTYTWTHSYTHIQNNTVYCGLNLKCPRRFMYLNTWALLKPSITLVAVMDGFRSIRRWSLSGKSGSLVDIEILSACLRSRPPAPSSMHSMS